MIPPLSVLEYLASEDFAATGVAVYPVHAGKSIQDILDQYGNANSIEEREVLEKTLLLTYTFHGNNDALNVFIEKRGELIVQIAKLQKDLQAAVNPSLEKELSVYEAALSELEVKTAKTLWISDLELQVHSEREMCQLPVPPIWNSLMTLNKKEYCKMPEIDRNIVQWNLHLLQFQTTLIPEICALHEVIKVLKEGVDKLFQLLEKKPEPDVSEAKAAVEKLIGTYNSNRPAIENLDKRINAEKEILRKFQKKFHDLELSRQDRDLLYRSIGELKETLKELEFRWDEKFKSFIVEVVQELNLIACSIHNNGIMRSNVFYSMKMVSPKTEYVSLPDI